MYKTTVVVDGMHCSMCESQVKSLVMKILPDAKLSASHRKGTLTIEGSFIPSGNLAVSYTHLTLPTSDLV